MENSDKEVLPDDIKLSNFKELQEMENIQWRYRVMIEFVRDEWDDARHPIWDMFVMFDKLMNSAKAKESLVNITIKNWVLNILNSLASVKWFHTYSDYLVILWIAEWSDAIKEQLNKTFQYSLQEISEEEYKEILEAKKKAADEEAKANEEAANTLEESDAKATS